jgi:hypothetical protein
MRWIWLFSTFIVRSRPKGDAASFKKNCMCSNDFVTQKVYFSDFLKVNASLRRLNNVTGVYLVRVSLPLIDQQSLRHFVRYWPLLPFPLIRGL